ncbi:hypothetical protein B5G20_07970 [Collinsella sp. An7]|uniref:MurR/RpiR family transcriptional regulator n=1 Tax=Collinsella sp. An7 TaxID=1965651 RepID=UPI000B3ABC5C|nr:MurR/RpiR family transcriptional regulator [Collinsella sp. An7]OUN46507.1 hypothetical protein B5G20_07970 [Collinsella sp. An7]
MQHRFEDLVSTHFDSLGENDMLCLRYVVAHRDAVCDMGIEELAHACSVSRSTVMRFAQKLDLHGFTELKTLLKWERDAQQRPSLDMVDEACEASISTIRSFRNLDCTDFCHDLAHARRIFSFGTGNLQKSACREFKRNLLGLGCLVDNIAGESELAKTIPLMQPDDLVFIVSQRGESEYLRRSIAQIAARGVTIASLTLTSNNYLANHAQHALFVHPHQIEIGAAVPFHSNAAVFFVVELIGVKFAEYLQAQQTPRAQD